MAGEPPVLGDGEIRFLAAGKAGEDDGVSFDGSATDVVCSGEERESAGEEAFSSAFHAVPTSSASSRYRYVSVWSGPSKVVCPFWLTVLYVTHSMTGLLFASL